MMNVIVFEIFRFGLHHQEQAKRGQNAPDILKHHLEN